MRSRGHWRKMSVPLEAEGILVAFRCSKRILSSSRMFPRSLIRSNIDYSRITFGTVKDVVYVRGAFKCTFQRISRPEGKWDDLS